MSDERCSADTSADYDPGTIARNLRGLAARMQYRVEVIETRDDKGTGAVTGAGIGIGYLLAKRHRHAVAIREDH